MRLLVSIALLTTATACISTRKQIERAAAYEQEAMHQEAYAIYADTYDRNRRSVEARVGMRRTAQALLDRMIDRASAAYLLHDLATGDQERRRAMEHKEAMARKGLDLQWDPMLESKREGAVSAEADRLFARAEAAFREDRFAEAGELATQCARLVPERRDAEHLAKLARVEPLYREALRAQELGLWREAFRKFDQVSKQDPAHRDCLSRLNACKEKAAYTVAYIPLVNHSLMLANLDMQTISGQLDAQFAANVKAELLDLQDPLIMLVDRDNTGQLLAEQQRQMSGVYDDRYVAEAGKLMGARFVLTGKILRYDDVLRKEIEVQVQLIDAESGRVHLAEIVRVNKQEIARGAPRAQLLERAAKRTAQRLAEFDPASR